MQIGFMESEEGEGTCGCGCDRKWGEGKRVE